MVHGQSLITSEGLGIYFIYPGKGNDHHGFWFAKSLESLSQSVDDREQFGVVVLKSLPDSDPPESVENGEVELVDEVKRFLSVLEDESFEEFHLLLDQLLHALLTEAKIPQGPESKPPLLHPGLSLT